MDARTWLADYVSTIADVDVPGLGLRRNPGNVLRLLASLGRLAASPINRAAMASDVGGAGGAIAAETMVNYLEALERLLLIEPLPAWRPHMRSRARLRTTAVHHFVDPSVGLAALRAGSKEMLRDLEAAGLQFESMVLRDLRVYGQSEGAMWSSWRDTQSGAEVDAIAELPDGRWAAFEVKLGEGAVDSAARSLRGFADRVDVERHGEPAALIVITGGRYAYRRPDGVVVVPITALGP